MKSQSNLSKHFAVIVLVTIVILLIPLAAMKFSDEVNWSAGDFVVAAILLIGSGLIYEFVSRKMRSHLYKIAAGIFVASSLILIWANLAVGIIGNEDNPANAMYIIVIAVGIVGSVITRFKPIGMTRTLLTMAAAQMLVPVIALIIWQPQADSMEGLLGILGVFSLNAFFAVLFISSALLFKRAGASVSK